MKWQQAIIPAAFGIVIYSIYTSRPKWIDDLLIRGYGLDHMTDRGTSQQEQQLFEEAAGVASQTGLPVGWVYKLMQLGVGINHLNQAGCDVIETMQQMGPPMNCLPQTLSEYRDKVLFAVASGFHHANEGDK